MQKEDFLEGFVAHLLTHNALKSAVKSVAKEYLQMTKPEYVEDISEDNPKAVKCKDCGRLFIPTSQKQKSCAKKCKDAFWRANHKDRKHVYFKVKGKSKVMWQKKNESIEQFEKRVEETKQNLNSV